MAIEFPCSQCGKLLRVGDDAAGKQARCPSCGTVQSIPAATPPTQNPFGAPVPPPPKARESKTDVNPYQAPAGGAWQPEGAVPAGPLQLRAIDAGDVLNRTWIIFKSQFWMITLAAFIWWVVQAAFGAVVGQIVTLPIMAAAGGGVGGGGGGGPPNLTPVFASQFIVQALGFLFGTWLDAGMAVYMLKTARGEPASLGDLFGGAPFWLSAVLARLLYILAVLFASLLLFIPGVIVWLMFSQYLYLIIDRRQGVLEAIGTSCSLTDGSKVGVFVLVIATIGVGILGVLACCVGIWPAMGFVALMWAVTYLAMTGQPTADAILDQPAAMPSASPFVPPNPELR